MVEKILNNTTPYGKIRASHEGSLHSSTLNHSFLELDPRLLCNIPRRVGLVVSVFASHVAGRGFAPQLGHAQYQHENGRTHAPPPPMHGTHALG